MTFDSGDLEIQDVEDYAPKKENFSHQELIMQCLRKCVEAGSVEMIEGRMQTRKDRMGNSLSVWIPDSRKVFIESVKTCKNFMICDFDKDAKEKIEEILEKIKTDKKQYIQNEHDWFNDLPYNVRTSYVKEFGGILKEAFNLHYSYSNLFISEEIDHYRNVLEELNLLTKRLDFYEGTLMEG